MPIYQLTPELVFPPPRLAEPDGLLAVGGDLRVDRLLLAYASGIFPWYSGGDPILWWSPDPRMVFFPGQWEPSKSLRRLLNKGVFDLSMDTDFPGVIEGCATARGPRRDSTWITPEMLAAYVRLHRGGYAHSVECRQDGELVGGLYGVSLGACFFGESMFSRRSNASKAAFAALMAQTASWGFHVVDGQVKNEHLTRLGAVEVSRKRFLRILSDALQTKTRRGQWKLAVQP
jgi:leucyl/phenylalanyl-tRNA--protein transferase